MVSNNGGILDASYAAKKGRTTRFRSKPSVRGYVKYQFNTETHRNLFKHRSSDVQSAEYSASQELIERGAKTQ
jgi:hypothetical protein